jgi:flotillin
MDVVQGIIVVPIVLIVLIVAALFVKSRYKVTTAGSALVVSGGKNLRVLPGGGAFVSPLHKHQLFSLEVMTVQSEDQETQTKTLVPVIVKWTAQLRADTETEGALTRAVTGFANYTPAQISNSLQQTLDGEVRAVVATMTPEQVVQDKDDFATKVKSGVVERMTELGFILVSLNIAEVTDDHGHYHNLAALDRETRRREAETLTAQASQQVAVAQAKADEGSREAELNRDLAVAEKTREVTLRQAAIKVETDEAQANADIAGQLQTELRKQELATREGQVEVVREQQREAAAAARRNVEVTEAQTAKERDEIAAASKARQEEIEAQAAAVVAKATAEGEAQANAALAKGEAEAAIARAEGEAASIAKTTEARTDEIRRTGLAQAEVTKAQGEAEAEAALAKGTAEAKVQSLMAEALAANNGANLQVSLAEIQRDTTVKVYTTVGEAMGRIGEHATFIDMGSGSNGGGDLFTKVLGNVPELLKQLNVKSMALNGTPFGESVGSVVSAISGSSNADNPQPLASSEAQQEDASPAASSVDVLQEGESATAGPSEQQPAADDSAER